jgi:hypothetical protein
VSWIDRPDFVFFLRPFFSFATRFTSCWVFALSELHLVRSVVEDFRFQFSCISLPAGQGPFGSGARASFRPWLLHAQGSCSSTGPRELGVGLVSFLQTTHHGLIFLLSARCSDYALPQVARKDSLLPLLIPDFAGLVFLAKHR